jgi:hypothetical protein
MTEDDHEELLGVLAGIKGRFLVSGYHSKLYDNAARRHGWRLQHEFDLPNHAAGGRTKRRMTDCLWSNY